MRMKLLKGSSRWAAVIAVGYRVNSKKATRFRQWATKTLKEYIAKGFVLNADMYGGHNVQIILSMFEIVK